MVTKMNNPPRVIMVIIVAVLVISFAGPVYADFPLPEVPGLVGISTVTSMDAQGIVTTSTSVGLQLGSHTLNDPPLENGGFLWAWFPLGPSGPRIDGHSVDPYVISRYKGAPVPPGEVQYTAGYNEDVTAVSGSLTYQKTMSISTGNKSAGEENIGADRVVTFTGGDGGRMTTREDLLLDGAGAQTVAANQVCCPFTGTAGPFFPPFCNIVMSGSSADISTGSISTTAGVRFISASVDIPVAETYRVNVKGVTGSGGTGASGTVGAFMKVNLQEAIEQEVPRRYVTDPIGYIPVKVEGLSYSETSTASGLIHTFTKDMRYQSGIRPV